MSMETVMPAAPSSTDNSAARARQFRQALVVWGIFIVLAVLLNGTIPFALGMDLHAWTASPLKTVLFSFVFYAIMFTALPITLIKGWETVRQRGFLAPLCLAILGITLALRFWPGMLIALAALAYLHRRFDLSGYGIRSRGWTGDLLAILLIGILGLVPLLMQQPSAGFSLERAGFAVLKRLFANPASSIENFVYFGFLAERISYRAGKWLTPLLIGLMYTMHKMTNPEYWYGGMSFGFVSVGVALWCAIYLWRRSAVAVWLGDGLYRFVTALF